VKEHGLSIGRACRVARLSRAAWYRRPRSCKERTTGDQVARTGAVLGANKVEVGSPTLDLEIQWRPTPSGPLMEPFGSGRPCLHRRRKMLAFSQLVRIPQPSWLDSQLLAPVPFGGTDRNVVMPWAANHAPAIPVFEAIEDEESYWIAEQLCTRSLYCH
jgi:hypothetical protein